LIVAGFLQVFVAAATAEHDATFWKQIKDNNCALPPNESADKLSLEIADLAASANPVLRDEYGYEIFATWIYRQQLLSSDQLEAVRRKLLTEMVFHLGDSDNDTVFRRSFSALYMSVLAAQDLQKPFLSPAAFTETLDTALRCYAAEKDLRGYVPGKGWAHATAHVADLLKFLSRNPKLAIENQKRIVDAIAQRCRTISSPFAWGEDARMAAALLSVVDRKDFEPSIFNDWFNGAVADDKELWKKPDLNAEAYIKVRAQANVMAHLAARIAAQKNQEIAQQFREALDATLAQIDR
jgi:hypothetical protein